MTRELSDQELKDYATWLIYDQAAEPIKFPAIHEAVADYFVADFELTCEQARRVNEYISSASITVIVE